MWPTVLNRFQYWSTYYTGSNIKIVRYLISIFLFKVNIGNCNYFMWVSTLKCQTRANMLKDKWETMYFMLNFSWAWAWHSSAPAYFIIQLGEVWPFLPKYKEKERINKLGFANHAFCLDCLTYWKWTCSLVLPLSPIIKYREFYLTELCTFISAI